MEVALGPCLYRVDCGLCDGDGGHCEAGGRAELEVSCAYGEVCEEDLQGDEVSHCPTSWARCRSEPWNDGG